MLRFRRCLRRRVYLLPGSERQREVDSELRADTLGTLHLDRATHLFDEGFDDRKSETGADDLILRCGMLSGKFIEDVRQIVRAHADAAVLTGEAITCLLLILGWKLMNLHADGVPIRGVLDGIAHDIEIDLLQLRLITVRKLMRYMGVLGVLNVLFLDVGFKYRIDGVEQCTEVRHFELQRRTAAFDSGHLQHLVDDGQQQTAGVLNLLKIFSRLFLIIEISMQQLREAHDGVHRRPDIMAHIKEEAGLRFTRLLRLRGRQLQFLCILLFVIAFHKEHIEKRSDQKR